MRVAHMKNFLRLNASKEVAQTYLNPWWAYLYDNFVSLDVVFEYSPRDLPAVKGNITFLLWDQFFVENGAEAGSYQVLG